MTKLARRELSLFFLHIPKTAGTTLIQHFVDAVGPAESDTFIEGRRSEWSALGLKTFTSGHLYFPEYERLAPNPERILATVFRDPVKRLVSHLRYQDRFSQPEHEAVYEAWPTYIREATDRLRGIDFNSATSINGYLEDLSPWEKLTFDNTQTRFLIEDPGEDLENYREHVTEADGDVAIQRLRAIDVVGDTKDLSAFASEAARRAGLVVRPELPILNESGCRRDIDASQPEIRAVLETHSVIDMRIYSAVLRRLKDEAARGVGH